MSIYYHLWATDRTNSHIPGSCATRRLAARLIPRFIHKFPHLVDQSAVGLMTLYQYKTTTEYDVESIVSATKLDALRGLADVLEASVKLADKAVPTMLRVVDFLLRFVEPNPVIVRFGSLPVKSID